MSPVPPLISCALPPHSSQGRAAQLLPGDSGEGRQAVGGKLDSAETRHRDANFLGSQQQLMLRSYKSAYIMKLIT